MIEALPSHGMNIWKGQQSMASNCRCQKCGQPLDCGDSLCAICETENGDSCYFREVKPDEIEDIDEVSPQVV